MKRLFLAGLLGLGLVRLAPAQDAIYINNGIVNYATNIDALAFVNNGLFAQPVNAILTNLVGPLLSVKVFNPSLSAYDFSDVDDYTNRGVMASDTGFKFDNAPSSFGVRHASSSFMNLNPGLVAAASFTNVFSTNFVFIIGISPRLNIAATNIVNTGLLDIGINGLVTMDGKSINLSTGRLHMEGFDDATSLLSQIGVGSGSFVIGVRDVGVFPITWGVGRQTNLLSLANVTPPAAFSPGNNVTNITGTAAIQQILFSSPSVFANVTPLDTNDITYSVIYVQDTLGRVSTDVRFQAGTVDFAVPIVRWTSTYTNAYTGLPATNTLFLEDFFAVTTNLQLVTNIVFTQNPVTPGMPANYSFLRTFAGYDLLPGGNTPFDLTVFTGALNTNGLLRATNDYSAVNVSVGQSTLQFDPTIPSQNLTNLGGRISINATEDLNLNGTIMDGFNYASISGTNHFSGSTNAQLVFPYADIKLKSTNGLLNFTNIVAPTIPRLNGPIDVCSFRWTNLTRGSFIGGNGNTNFYAITNRYHILMVLSALNPSAPPQVKDLFLRSTNGPGDIVISDIINVSNSLVIDAKSLTISSNAPGSPSDTGQLNLISTGIIWSSSLSTNLQSLTNFGSITSGNLIYFQTRLNQSFPSPGDGPYSNFVNHASISTAGDIIWANRFENTGPGPARATISSTIGPISVQSVTALMTNGSFASLLGDMTVSSSSLTISNHILSSSGFLSIGGSNSLNDGISGVVTNALVGANIWIAGDGFNLTARPTASSSLFGTTISNFTLPNVQSENVCAGGVNTTLTTNGFNNVLPAMSNNVPIGRLVLNGGSPTSVFHFKGLDTVNPYALYVDRIELAGGATNRVPPNFPALHVDTNVTIYFLRAVIGNTDISEKLDGANTNRLRWLSNYVGRFSFVNITYPDAQTFQFNRALADSFTIDSDSDGSVNGIDPTPFPEPFTGSSIGLTITLTNQPTPKALIKWQTPAGATNYLYSQNVGSTNWSLVTNFVQGPVSAPITVSDPMQNSRLYRVRIDPLHN